MVGTALSWRWTLTDYYGIAHFWNLPGGTWPQIWCIHTACLSQVSSKEKVPWILVPCTVFPKNQHSQASAFVSRISCILLVDSLAPLIPSSCCHNSFSGIYRHVHSDTSVFQYNSLSASKRLVWCFQLPKAVQDSLANPLLLLKIV